MKINMRITIIFFSFIEQGTAKTLCSVDSGFYPQMIDDRIQINLIDLFTIIINTIHVNLKTNTAQKKMLTIFSNGHGSTQSNYQFENQAESIERL